VRCLSRTLQKPIVQSSINCSLGQLVSGQKVKFLLIGHFEARCSAVADEEETVTASVASKPPQIVIELALVARRLDLNPGGLFGQSLARNKINIALIVAENGLSAPTVVAEDKIDHRLKILPVQLSNHLIGYPLLPAQESTPHVL
jgi:hypothetical protein